LNNAFLVLFFSLIDDNLSSNKILDTLGLKHASLRDKIIEFEKRYSVTAQAEYGLEERKYIVDIFLSITDKSEENILCMLIENKIKKEAASANQAASQYLSFSKSESNNKGRCTYSVVLTADDQRFAEMYEKVKSVNEHSVWLKWTNTSAPDNSVAAILRRLIKYEHEAEIQPIDPNTQYIIKSFIDYILTEYSQKSGQKNRSYNGFEVASYATFILDNKKYVLKRFENNMVRLFNDDDDLMEIEVLPVLRAANKVLGLGVDINHSTGKVKNTQVFGKDIINALNRRETAQV